MVMVYQEKYYVGFKINAKRIILNKHVSTMCIEVKKNLDKTKNKKSSQRQKTFSMIG